MYEQFYGLREAPFELAADPKYLYRCPGHAEALANLQYGLSSAKAITLMIGEAGTGKTTLLNAALASEVCGHVRGVCLSNPTLTRTEFIELLATRFELSARAGRSKAPLLSELEALVRERRARGEITALVIDEAQSLSTDLLEEIRLLANMESGSTKLLPLLLIGQPELAVRLEEGDLRQLKQRVALRCDLRPLTLNETVGYVATRVRTVGGDPTRLFTREAILLIHEHSRGIPRTISVICDNSLVQGFALGRELIDSAIVLEVCRDFRTAPATRAPARDVPETLSATASPTSVEEAESESARWPRIAAFGRRALRDARQVTR